jgi:TPP-dependent pyruvate/acetoin dehydrogenase alpha subunit
MSEQVKVAGARKEPQDIARNVSSRHQFADMMGSVQQQCEARQMCMHQRRWSKCAGTNEDAPSKQQLCQLSSTSEDDSL